MFVKFTPSIFTRAQSYWDALQRNEIYLDGFKCFRFIWCLLPTYTKHA